MRDEIDNKLQKLDLSFSELRTSTLGVIKQAYYLSETLKRKAEIYHKRYVAVANNIEEIVAVKTTDMKWVSANNVLCQKLNVQREQLIGLTNQQIIDKFPKTKQIIQQLDVAEKEVLQTKSAKTTTININGQTFNMIVDLISTEDNKQQELVVVGLLNSEGVNDGR